MVLPFLRKIAVRVYKFLILKILYPMVYRAFCIRPVKKNKVVFLELRSLKITNSFELIYRKISELGDFDIRCHFIGETILKALPQFKRSIAFLKDYATAGTVFINDASQLTSCVRLRPGTKLVQLWHACGAFKKFGFSTADKIFGYNRKRMLRYPYYKNITAVAVSSPEVAWAYKEAMNADYFNIRIMPLGVARTDVFFDEDFIKRSREKVRSNFPFSEGKKIIIYAPTFRGEVLSAKTGEINISRMYKELSGEYFLLIKHHPYVKKPPAVPDEFKTFAADVSGIFDIEELICAGDVCISDYSSLVFEYSLFERPIIFYAYDIDEYNDWRGFYYSYEELTPGPVLKTTDEIIDYLKNVDKEFDKRRVSEFKKRFMSSCDGRSCERIIKTFLLDNGQGE